jgi:diguanylate cyclase (GGDEF)-like protein
MNDREFRKALVECARALTLELSLQEVLDHLSRQVLRAVPAAGAEVVLLIDTDAAHPAVVSSEAGNLGSATTFSFPICVDSGCRGVLVLHVDPAPPLEEEDLEAAQGLAEVIAAYVYEVRVRDAAQESAAVLRDRALHDPLTGVPNRWLFRDRLDQALAKTARNPTLVGLLFIDVDGMKAINDSYGHDAGDALLCGVVARISDVLRPGDTLARIGGDEFVVVCDELNFQTQAQEVADRILSQFTHPLDAAGHAVTATVSIGIAVASTALGDADELLTQADAAMYVAKRRGGGRKATAAARNGSRLS